MPTIVSNAERSTANLAEELVEVEQQISQLEAKRVRLLARFCQSKTFRDMEYSSPSAFLIYRCRIAPSRAVRLVAQAHALAEMPTTSAAWVEGPLSSDQVRGLIGAHQVDPTTFSSHEQILVDICSQLGVVDSVRAVDYWRQAVDHHQGQDGSEKLFQQRRLHLSQTFEGMFRIDGYLDPVAGEMVRTALDAATPPPASDDERSPAQRRADALTDLCRQALDSGDLPEQGGEKPHLLALVDSHRINCHVGMMGMSETEGGTILSQVDIETLTCDCATSRVVFGPNSEIVDVGRKTRVIPPALRRAIIARDRHCQHPGCRRPAKWCDIDHIIPWQEGGPTTADNLQLLCRYHHRLKHQKSASLVDDDDGLRVTPADVSFEHW